MDAGANLNRFCRREWREWNAFAQFTGVSLVSMAGPISAI